MHLITDNGLFAAQEIVPLITIVIAICFWVYNVISGKNAQAVPPRQRPRAPARPRDERLQDEIDIFLSEISPNRPKPEQQRPAANRPAAGNRPGADTDAGGGRRRKPAKPPATSVAQAQEKRRPPGSNVAGRGSPGKGNLGNAIRQQVAEQLPEHKIDREVAEDLKTQVDASVAQHLGAFSGGVAPPSPGTDRATERAHAARIAKLVRQPATIRDAIMINAILTRPVGRRGR